MDTGLEDKVALVTGGSRGIGRAIVLELAKEGACVALTYLKSEAAAKEVQAKVVSTGRRAMAIRADATDMQKASEVVDAVVKTFGKIDILVNNVGLRGERKSFWQCTKNDWDEQIVP